MMSIVGFTPLCSIVVPLYNKEQAIRGCLDSIRAQTVSSVEILVVDDGSTDGSVAIVEEIAREDDRVVLMREPNRGPAASRNIGLGTALGPYVCFLDADDKLDPVFLEQLIALMKREHTDVARSSQLFVEIAEDGTPISQQVRSVTDRAHSVPGSQLYHRLFADLEAPLMPAHSALYKRDFLVRRKLSFNEELRHLEDVLFVVCLYACDSRVALSDQPLYVYQHQAASALSEDRGGLVAALPPFSASLETLESSNPIAASERQLRLRYCAIVALTALTSPVPKNDPYIFRDFLRSKTVVKLINDLHSRDLPNSLLTARALARLDYPNLLNTYCSGLARARSIRKFWRS
ncbi:MAG: glycosyltransferase [Coriobacteriia bacterium]|nr:glycosyltransferase [Coriobacteriia bacterium]